MNAIEIRRALHNMFDGSKHYAIVEDICCPTGCGMSSMDMVVFDCYSYDKFRIDGIDIVPSEKELKRKLGGQDKLTTFFGCIDCYTLACSAGAVDMSAVPSNWGVIAVDDSGKADYVREPIALLDKCHGLDRKFIVACLLELRHSTASEEALRSEYSHGFNEGMERAAVSYERKIEVYKQITRERDRAYWLLDKLGFKPWQINAFLLGPEEEE